MSRRQGERVLDSFPDTIDLNQGSFSNNDTVDHSAASDDLLNPVENQLPNYMLSSIEGNNSFINPNISHTRSVSGWDVGESSSLANNLQNEVNSDVSRTRHGWSSSFNACSGTDERTEDWSFESCNVISAGYGGNQATGRFPSMQNYGSNRGSLNVNVNVNMNYGYASENNDQRGIGAGQSPTYYRSDQSETRQIPSSYASSNARGTSSAFSSTLLENDDTPGPSLDTGGLSCKRKALEGARQINPGGSSSSSQPMENVMQHSVPFLHTTPGSLSISSDPGNLTRASHSEQINPRSGFGLNRVASGIHPSLSVPGFRESPARDFGVRSNFGHQPVSFHMPICSDVRHSGVYAAQQPLRPISNIDSSEARSPFSFPINPSNSVNQSHTMHMSEARSTLPFPWNGSPNSQSASSSRSLMLTGERSSAANEAVNFRNLLRNNAENPLFVSTPETRNMLQDQIDWSFVPGTSRSSGNHSSRSRIDSSSSVRTSPPVWMQHQNPRMQSQQTSSEFSLRAPFPFVESDSDQRSHFSAISSASSSSDEVATSIQVRNQSDQRSAFSMTVSGGDVSGWHALAADSDGRQRLRRHSLHAMRRDAHLREEDIILFDTYINELAEMHERNREMRIDVDNMSYEDLLALEERIGNVSTGLSEEKIMGSMEQRKYEPFGSSPNLEPCCICQEDYIGGDDIGILDCRHEFHTKCIKQWLTLKNLCPICKTTALDT